MTDHNHLPRCPYCGEHMGLECNTKNMYWYECYKCGATTPQEGAEQAAYEAAMNRWQEPTAHTAEGAAILAGRLQHKPRLILSGKGARIEDADDRDMLRMLEALAEAMEARGWCTDAIWADVHRIAWWMDQRSDALAEATRDER